MGLNIQMPDTIPSRGLSPMVGKETLKTLHTCEGSHDHWARSASEHDGGRTKEVLCGPARM